MEPQVSPKPSQSAFESALATVDPEVFAALEREQERQEEGIELIASENFTSPAVMAAMGSVMTNKYAEGYPGRRYYGGCENVDVVETLAIERAKALFGAEHANVQPHSGSAANMAAYMALMQPGDPMLAMRLDHGGHLTHGSKVSFSGKLYAVHFYGVDDATETIDYDRVRERALAVKPKVIVAGASAYPRIIDFERFRQIADEVAAVLVVDMAHIAGLVAAGVHPSPVPHAHVVTSTTHKTLRGPRGGLILCQTALAKKIDKSVFPANQGGPLMHVIAAKAVALREAQQPEFVAYQKQVAANAKVLAEALARQGLRPCSGGTDNHLILIDLRETPLTGKAVEDRLSEVGIIVNMNKIPNDPRNARETSGIRVGTAAVTTRGMDAQAMQLIAEIVGKMIFQGDSSSVREWAVQQVAALTARFPLYRA